MARISTYNLDGTISDTDKVIGTDSSNTTTKNFRVQDLKEFIYSEISGNMTIAADGTASIATSNIALGINSGNYVASITGGVGVDSTAATSGAVTNHTLSLDLSELSTVTSISTGDHVATSSSSAGSLITVDNLFIKSPKLVSEAVIANGDYMLFLDGGATGDMKKESLSDISTLFAGNGLASSSSIINLDLNSLSAKSSIVQGDSLIIVDSEDSNSNKKVTYAILEDEVYSNISGDVTINSSGVSTIGAGKVHGTMLNSDVPDSSGTLILNSNQLKVAKVPNALTAGNGLASGGTFDGANARTFSLDLNELTGAVIANGDFIPFIDATDNTTKKEALSDIVTLLAGDGLSASGSVLSVGVDDSTIETNLDALRVKANGITNSHINKTSITGQSDLGDAFADADTILLHDATASALREGTMAHLASYVNGAYDLEASLEALNSSDNIIKIGHSSDKVQIIGTFQVDGVSTLTGNTTVTGSLTANGLAFPANSAGSNGQILTKASDGTIGFTSASSTSVNDVASDNASHLPIVLHDESNNLLDDTGTFTYQPSTGILKVPDITLPSTGVITFDDSTDFSLTHVANTGVLISGTQELQFGSSNSKIKEGGTGVLELTAPIVDINASTRVDVSNLFQVGGNLTFTNDGNHDIVVNSTAAGTPGKYLAISAGSAAASGSNNTNGGNLFLQSGNGDGNGTSDIIFKTKTATGGNSAIERMRINNAGIVMTAASPLDVDGSANIAGNLVLGANLSVPGSLNLDSVANANLGVTINNVQISSNTFSDSDNTLMTAAAIDDRIIGAQSMGSGFILEDADGTELAITENKEVKFIGSGGLTINWTDTDNGTDGDPYDLTFTIGTLDQNTTGSAATLTTARNFSLTGDVTASAVSFNGSAVVALSTSLADNTVDSSELVNGSIDTEHLSSGCTAPKVTVTDLTNSAYHPIVLHNDSNQLFDDTDNFQFKQTNSTISSTTDNQYTLTLGETTNYAHYLHGGNIDFKSGATISTHDAGFYIMGNAYYKLVSGSGGFVKKIAAPSEVLTLRDQKLSLSVHTSNGNTSDKMTLTEVFSVTAAGNLTVTGELDAATLDISGNADIAGNLTGVDNLTMSGVLDITNTTESTSTTTGALKVAGGVGVAKDLYVEEQLFVGNAPGSDGTSGRSIFSKYSGSNFVEVVNSSSSNGGRIVLGPTSSGFNGLYSRNYNATAGREFRLIQLSATVITVATDGDTTFVGDVTTGSSKNFTGGNFITSSDKRLKSEIEPIKKGLEVIKQFTSYNYIKGGKKESGFIAQEVREAIPHTVYENNEGMLSMSDRGVVAHMHKAILELEKRLISIEEKLK